MSSSADPVENSQQSKVGLQKLVQSPRRRSSLTSLQCEPLILVAATCLIAEFGRCTAAPNAGTTQDSRSGSGGYISAQHSKSEEAMISPELEAPISFSFPEWLSFNFDGADGYSSAFPLVVSSSYFDDVDSLERRFRRNVLLETEGVPGDVAANESPPKGPANFVSDADLIDRQMLTSMVSRSKRYSSARQQSAAEKPLRSLLMKSKKPFLHRQINKKMATAPRLMSVALKRVVRSPQSIRGYSSDLPPYKNANHVFEDRGKHRPTSKLGVDREKERKTYLSAYSPDTAQMLRKHTRFSFRG